jgi:hypothetical protein
LVTLEGGGDLVWRLGPREARVEDLDPLQAPSRERRGEPRPDRLDLGELGHSSSPSGHDLEHNGPLLRRLRAEAKTRLQLRRRRFG